jgi:hypothetical protein
MVITGLAAGSGQAAAAGTVTLDRSCYSPGDPVTETGSGFSPAAGVLENLSLIRLSVGRPLATLQAPLVTTDSTGAFSRQLRAPRLASARDREEIALASFTDQALGDAAPLVTAQWTLSAWATEIPEWRRSVNTADPAKSMLVDTYGWTTAGKNVYAHYYRGTTFVKAVKFGALTGPCGNFKRRVKQFPYAADAKLGRGGDGRRLRALFRCRRTGEHRASVLDGRRLLRRRLGGGELQQDLRSIRRGFGKCAPEQHRRGIGCSAGHRRRGGGAQRLDGCLVAGGWRDEQVRRGALRALAIEQTSRGGGVPETASR